MKRELSPRRPNLEIWFMSLCEMRWTELSTTARRNLSEQKRNAVSLILLSDDVEKFSVYLTAEGERKASILKSDKKNVQAFSTLNSIALSKLILFNRKRQGKASKILLKDWQFNKKANITSKMAGCLSEVEKGLINILERLEIRGKRGRTVPILITKEINEWVQLLLDTRVHHINPLNSYLFASSSQDSHIRGSDSLRNHSSLCGAKQPELLRSNRLRKHVATMAQVLNLDQSEMELLAEFLRHDIRVHREYYRLDIDALQLARVSKVFLAAESGTLAQFAGKSLTEIEVGENDTVEFGNDESGWSEESESETEELEEACTRKIPGHSKPEVHKKIKNSPTFSFFKKRKADEEDEDIVRPKKKFVRRQWTNREVIAVKMHLAKEISFRQLPGKKMIDKFLETGEIDRTWKNVKDHLRNTYKL